MRSLSSLALLALTLALALAAGANEAQPAAADPQLERRVTALTENLRCLVCQNQSLADSHAELAIDLKNQVREKLKNGESEEQIVDYMVARYGDFVLYKPPFKLTTLALWFGPLALFVFGLLVLFRYLARRRKVVTDAPMSDADRRRAQTLLGAAGEETK